MRRLQIKKTAKTDIPANFIGEASGLAVVIVRGQKGDPMDKEEIIERLEEIAKHAVHVLGEEPFFMSLDDGIAIHEAIDILKSAQPEIIRCKDCKHRPFDSEDTQGFGVEFPDEMCPCQCDDGWYNWRPNNEWFCANAERRTDETDRC